ncbi:MAG: restriction endonuclease subunit S [Candidatus Riflebacteria bacterium]|nr:restriction endonuclease subunit S [Candidatus Riflebacteria bacterium]
MAEWVPISELFDFQKGTLQSSKCTPGQYTFITAAEEWKTHTHFSHDCEALIFAMAASGSLGRTHYFKGKFISSDLCFILTPKENRKLILKFYHRVFNFLREDIVKKTSTGTAKLSINQTNLGNYRLPYFEIKHQEKFGKKLACISEIKNSMVCINAEDADILMRLRQAILKDAIEGKLTAKWREEHLVRKGDSEYDAAALLEQIKVEKQKLIAKGEIKKEKPLPLVNLDEMPFQLPEGWVWCHLGELIRYAEAGKSFLCKEKEAKGSSWGVIKTSAITSGQFLESENKLFTDNQPSDVSKK